MRSWPPLLMPPPPPPFVDVDDEDDAGDMTAGWGPTRGRSDKTKEIQSVMRKCGSTIGSW